MSAYTAPRWCARRVILRHGAVFYRAGDVTPRPNSVESKYFRIDEMHLATRANRYHPSICREGRAGAYERIMGYLREAPPTPSTPYAPLPTTPDHATAHQ